MENTTMQLWEIQGFESSSVKTLFIGKTANGQDCVGCAWDAFTTYVYAYEGIVDTFLFYLETFKSVGQAMSATKLRDGMEEAVYNQPYTAGMRQQVHNQLYRMSRYDVKSAMTANIVVHQNLWNDTPENAIKNLISSGDIEAEHSRLVSIIRHREVCA
jgi:hypothetical protein